MSVIGIDIGTAGCVVTTIEKSGLKMVRNDVSELITPSLVGYDNEVRLTGQFAEARVKSNFKNTCRNMKNLIGRTLDDPVVKNETPFLLGAIEEAEDGTVGYVVNYKDQQHVMSASRVTATLLHTLKTLAEKSTNSTVKDVVIGVPGFYGDAQRRAVIHAAAIAGLNCLRVMNEHTAVALDYGMFRRSEFDAEKPRNVIFVCGGQSTVNVSVVSFTASGLKVLADGSDIRAVGRNFDLAIIEHFSKPFNAKYNCDLLKSPKRRLILEEAANRAKKILSANHETNFGAECIYEDEDITGFITREEFENDCAEYKQIITDLITHVVLQKAKLTMDQIHSVELVGGCTRIPFVHEAISAATGPEIPISRTLHMDETVARGCCLHAAMLSPQYKVRDYKVTDVISNNIVVSWNKVDGEIREAVAFPAGSDFNTVKYLTFDDRATDIDIAVDFKDAHDEAEGSTGGRLVEHVGKWKVVVPADKVAENSGGKVKVRFVLDVHGRVDLHSATLIQETTVTETVKSKRPKPKAQKKDAQQEAEGAEGDKMEEDKSQKGGDDSEAAAAEKGEEEEEFEEVEEQVTRTKSVKTELEVIAAPRKGVMTKEQLKKYIEAEQEMQKADRAYHELKDRLNELEATMYSVRDLVDQGYFPEAEKAGISDLLQKIEDWTYEEGDYADREAIMERLNNLKQTAGKAIDRAKEAKQRKEVVANFRHNVGELRNYLSNEGEQFAHVTAEMRAPVFEEIEKAEAWMREMEAVQNLRELHEDPAFTGSDLVSKYSHLAKMAESVMKTPKPKPVKTKDEEGAEAMDEDKKKTEEGDDEEQQQENNNNEGGADQDEQEEQEQEEVAEEVD